MSLQRTTFLVVEPDGSPAERLVAAIRAADVERVMELLPSATGPLGFGLLQAACCGHRDILELILDQGAPGGGPSPLLAAPPADALGRTPLHFAADRGDYAAAQLLLARGANVDAATKEGASPLHYAAAAGHRGVAELLLGQGAEVDRQAVDGSTPLLVAAESGHTHVAETLLRHGANPNSSDSGGLTPLLAALSGGHRRCATALLGAGARAGGRAQGRTALHWAAHHGMHRVLGKLLETAGAGDVNAEDEAGESPLLSASRRGHQECVELLLAHGASTDKANLGGVTPLMAAALFCHESVAAALLSRGAGVAARDATHKRTPLHWAALADAAAIAGSLLELGAELAAVDSTGATPMDLAVEHDCVQIVQLFTGRSAR